MMKQNRSISVKWQRSIVALACLLYGLLGSAYCQDNASELQPPTDSTVLLLQQTPPDGGMVNPAVGVHHLNLDAEVTLTAVSKPGYRFLYWMGDVIDPTANSTIVYLDTPKIVIAVFERSEYEFEIEEGLQNTLGGIGGMRPSAGDYGNQGFAGGIYPGYEWPQPPPWEPPVPPTIPSTPPVPQEEESDDFPVPIPEPATALLLGLGGLLFVKCRTKR